MKIKLKLNTVRIKNDCPIIALKQWRVYGFFLHKSEEYIQEYIYYDGAWRKYPNLYGYADLGDRIRLDQIHVQWKWENESKDKEATRGCSCTRVR